MRLFVAIAMPAEIGRMLEGLTGGLPGADWIEPHSYHLTLRFIGEVGRADAEEIDAALAALTVPAFDLTLAGIDYFGTADRPRTLWAGIEASPVLAHLARKIDRAIAVAGHPAEPRSFTPHVTLARLRDSSLPGVMRFVAANALFRSPAFPVEVFTLYESRQGSGGPVYRPLVDYALGEGAGPARRD